MTWPAPEVRARRAEPGEVPVGARRMRTLAEDAGWLVATTYARGTRPGRPPRVVDSLALRMVTRPAPGARRRAVAVWIDGRFACAFSWAADRPLRTHTATALRGVLTAWPE